MENLEKIIQGCIESFGENDEAKELFTKTLEEASEDAEFEISDIKDVYVAICEEVEMSSEYAKSIEKEMSKERDTGSIDSKHAGFNKDPKEKHDDNKETELSDTSIEGSDTSGNKIDDYANKLNNQAKQHVKDKQASIKEENFETLKTDIEGLFEDEEFSDELKEKAFTVIDALVKTTINKNIEEITESIVEEFAKILESEFSSIKETLSEELDEYLEHVSDNFIKENEVQTASLLKVELAENILESFKKALVENNIEIPEGKENVLEELESKNDELNNLYNNEIERNKTLSEEVKDLKKEKIIADICESDDELSDLDKEKLTELAEQVRFDTEEDFKAKIVTLKEAVTNKQTVKKGDQTILEEEEFNKEEKNLNSDVNKVLKAMSWIK